MADLTETVGRMWDQGRDTAEIARKLNFPEGRSSGCCTGCWMRSTPWNDQRTRARA
jgi:hypothetical protein